MTGAGAERIPDRMRSNIGPLGLEAVVGVTDTFVSHDELLVPGESVRVAA